VAAPDATALQRSDLNAFLFADVGTEANGTTLSVLSVLARRGTDPWNEAGRLAGLSKAEAVDSLAQTIATMPASLWPLPDASAIAARLISLLPARPTVGLDVSRIRLPARAWPLNQIALIAAAIALAVAFAFMMMKQ